MNVIRFGTILTGSILTASTLTGCSANFGAPGTNDPNFPPFEITQSEIVELESVGCAVRETKIECDRAQTSVASQGPAAIQSKIERTKERQRKIDSVRRSLNARLSGGPYEPSSAANALALKSSLDLESSSLGLEITGLDVVLMHETNYNQVFGYRCEGAYVRGLSVLQTSSDLIGVALGKPTLVRDDEAKHIASLDVVGRPPGTKGAYSPVRYQLTDHTDPNQQTNRHSVETDGEFEAHSFNEANSLMNCIRSRLSGSVRPFSDRPVASRTFACSADIKFTNKISTVRWEFTVAKDNEKDEGVEFAIEAMDEEMNVRPEGRALLQKFIGRAAWKKGAITFTIEDLAKKKKAFEVKTLNSLTTLTIEVDDNAGNGLSLACRALD